MHIDKATLCTLYAGLFPIWKCRVHPKRLYMIEVQTEKFEVMGGLVTAIPLSSKIIQKWMPLTSCLSPPQQNNNNAPIDFQGCFKEHSEMHLIL